MYRAIDVARHVINYCIDHGCPVTNLKLQKLLYYVQGKWFNQRRTKLIDEDFFAWQHGPVIPEIYSEYAKYAAGDIPRQNHPSVLDRVSAGVVNDIVEQYMRVPVWVLVENTHQEYPWKYTHQIYGDKARIASDMIEQHFSA